MLEAVRVPGIKPRKATARERAETYIRDELFWGRLRAGDRIDQDAVENALGVSRIPVREALIGLARDGLVHNDFSRGCFVADLDPPMLREHFEIWGVVSGMAAAGLVERGAEPYLADLEAYAWTVAESDDSFSAYRATADFRAIVHRHGAGRRFRSVVRSLDRYNLTNFYAIAGAREAASAGLHAELAAYRAGDAQAARSAVLCLARRCGELMIELLTTNGALTAPANTTRS